MLSPNDFLLSWERHMVFRKMAISNNYATSKILPDMKIEGYLNVTTEEESRRGDIDKLQRNEEESEKIKSNIFRKSEEKTNYLLKSKLTYEDKDQEPTTVKSKNNFLNLSILKHIWSLYSLTSATFLSAIHPYTHFITYQLIYPY